MVTRASLAEPINGSTPPGAEEQAPPKVMHVITDLDVGGAERMLVSYLMAPRKSPLDCFVVSLLSGGYFTTRLQGCGIRVDEMKMGRAIGNILSLFRIAATIRREKPNIIQSWLYHADLVATLALLLSGRIQKTRLFWGVRCSDMDTRHYRITLKFAIWACSKLSRIPDGIIANSHAGMSVHKTLGYNSKNFFVIPNGVDTNRFAPDADLKREVRRELNIPEDVFAITMVARRDPQKDHETFIKAIDLIPGAIGVLAGKGTEEFSDQPNLRRLGMREDIERIYAACDIVSLCSAFGEGFPNVLVEGMSAGLAPIATDVGDCALIIADIGKVVPPRDAEALAGAIQLIINSGHDKVKEVGRKARERIKQEYALERTVETFDDVYRSAE